MQQRRVVVIEDNPDDQMLFVRALRDHSASPSVRMISDGEEALDSLMGEHETPSIIFLDLNLPKMCGIELLGKLLRQVRYKAVPIIVMSIELDERRKFQAFEAGAKSCITKDVSFSRWQVKIRDVLNYWLTVNDPMKPITRDQYYSFDAITGKP